MVKALLCGNPNCGKTTLYNRLTGQRQYVGNWSGVTVDKAQGVLRTREGEMLILDLPGIYSLSALSMEEKAARGSILQEEAELILNIVDGTHLERSLYLSLQLIELGRPVVIALNMLDELRAQKGGVDCALLGRELGVPVIPISARSGEGIELLQREVFRQARQGRPPGAPAYDADTRRALEKIQRLIADACRARRCPPVFFAARLLAGEEEAAQELGLSSKCLREIEEISGQYAALRDDRAQRLAAARYRLIERITGRAVRQSAVLREWSEQMDKLVLHRLLALPVFFFMLFAVFSVTFGPPGRWLKGGIEQLIAAAGEVFSRLLFSCDAPGWTRSLIVEAVIGGVGGVLSFLPQMALLFFFLSLLEDSGYMARAAFLTDRLLRVLGLNGKSFIPMLMGFGCTTPAVMAARAMDNERDRQRTILLIPFMSCGARLPIYALFSGIFFPGREGTVVFCLYLLGMAVAVLCGLCLKKTVFYRDSSPFILELPPYRLPRLCDTLLHTWERSRGFLCKAGTVIFSMNIVLWLLQHVTPGLQPASGAQESVFGALGSLLAPLLRPLGFGSWQAAVALLCGLVAKESVVSALSLLYGAGDAAALSAAVAARFTPLSALSFMVFCLLYPPCLSAFVTICRELGSLRRALAAAAFQTGVAYLVSFLIYSFGLISPLNG
ncbi:MAG: ferrous iron transport protein B [Provencibacterium sp.]|nr:ferrous iron transport protein B [Provencibacterium sp.]